MVDKVVGDEILIVVTPFDVPFVSDQSSDLVIVEAEIINESTKGDLFNFIIIPDLFRWKLFAQEVFLIVG